jgi:mRNA-degrading endonuclease RelE of RelBE toxin-antitoxin system
MDAAKIARELASLPPEAQKEVVDFLAFLKTRYAPSRVAKRTKHAKLTDEPFIGMWRGRKDMQDSTTWVRNLRQCQWERGR